MKKLIVPIIIALLIVAGIAAATKFWVMPVLEEYAQGKADAMVQAGAELHEVTEELNASMGVALAKYQSHLLKWTGTGWLVIKSWPYDGYKDPLSFPD